MLNRLENNAKSNPLHQDALLMKVKMARNKIEAIQNPEEFQKLIDNVSILLIEIEAQLQHQDGTFYYTTHIYTVGKNFNTQ